MYRVQALFDKDSHNTATGQGLGPKCLHRKLLRMAVRQKERRCWGTLRKGGHQGGGHHQEQTGPREKVSLRANSPHALWALAPARWLGPVSFTSIPEPLWQRRVQEQHVDYKPPIQMLKHLQTLLYTHTRTCCTRMHTHTGVYAGGGV